MPPENSPACLGRLINPDDELVAVHDVPTMMRLLQVVHHNLADVIGVAPAQRGNHSCGLGPIQIGRLLEIPSVFRLASDTEVADRVHVPVVDHRRTQDKILQ